MGQIDRFRASTNEAYRREMQTRCKTDILFLARLLGYDLIVDRVHQPVSELCVRKNPDLSIAEQSRIKERLHLDPRGTFKSTMSIVDSIQWIICFPNIRICKLTATKPLGVAIVGEITDHFVKDKTADPTDFQLLFPEFCITPRDKRVGEYTAPCRTRDWRENTVMAFSIETSISGWHFDVLDPDDPVDTQNSSTVEGIKKVKRNFRINKKTLMPWGYVNYKGTRYNPFDLWGDIIEKARPGKVHTLIRSALRVKDGRRLDAGEFPAEKDVELLFPELLSYEFLKNEFEDDYESFMTQYMNDAHGGNEVTFSKEAIMNVTIGHEQVPLAGQVVAAFRFGSTSKPNLKYAAGAVGVIDGGRLFVVDALRGSFKPSVLANRVAHMLKKNGTHKVVIEETPGAKSLESAIQNYGVINGWPIEISWLEFQEDDGARDLRIKGTEPLVASGRLLFSDALKSIKEITNQFTNYGMIEELELPDVVSRLAESLPKSIISTTPDAEQDLAWELAKQRNLYDRTHGLGQYAPPEPIHEEPYVAPRNEYGLDDMLGGLNG